MRLFSRDESPEQASCDVTVCTARVYAELATMPQFILVSGMGSSIGRIRGEGLLNMLNGCLVSDIGQGLRLTWQMDGYETTAHSATISSVDDLEKFEALMRRQVA